jgi:DNA topoisomerase VI subunit B
MPPKKIISNVSIFESESKGLALPLDSKHLEPHPPKVMVGRDYDLCERKLRQRVSPFLATQNSKTVRLFS